MGAKVDQAPRRTRPRAAMLKRKGEPDEQPGIDRNNIAP